MSRYKTTNKVIAQPVGRKGGVVTNFGLRGKAASCLAVGHLIRFDKYDAFIAAVKAFQKQLPDEFEKSRDYGTLNVPQSF